MNGRRLLVASLVALSLTACSSGGGDPEGSGEQTQAPASADTSSSPTPTTPSAQDEYQRIAAGAPEVPTADGPAQYAVALAEQGADYSQCGESVARPSKCEKPASLGALELKQSVNVEIVLDASGSMNESIGGRKKIDIARESISRFVTQLPASARVSLRTFGNGADEPKSVSCASSDLVVPFGPRDADRVDKALSRTVIQGHTPLAGALEKAAADFESRSAKTNSNFVYVLSDGEETCDGDPAAAAKALTAASIDVQVNVIGFSVDSKAARQLKAAAASGNGLYADARDGEALNRAFDSVGDWKAWTAYYNCRYGEVEAEFSEARWRSANVRLCIQALTVKEQTDLGRAATDQLARLMEAIDARDAYYQEQIALLPAEMRLEVSALAREDVQKMRSAAHEAKRYAAEEGLKRRDVFYKVADGEQAAFVKQAQADRDAALAQLEAMREKVGLDQPEQ